MAGLVGLVLALVPIAALLLWREAWGHRSVELATAVALGWLGLVAVRNPGTTRNRVIAFVVLMVFHTAFWAAFEQVGSSFTVLADMAREVAGDAAEVVSVTKPGAEIHGYEPTPRDIVGAHGADLILWNGLNLELWFQQFLSKSLSSATEPSSSKHCRVSFAKSP